MERSEHTVVLKRLKGKLDRTKCERSCFFFRSASRLLSLLFSFFFCLFFSCCWFVLRFSRLSFVRTTIFGNRICLFCFLVAGRLRVR